MESSLFSSVLCSWYVNKIQILPSFTVRTRRTPAATSLDPRRRSAAGRAVRPRRKSDRPYGAVPCARPVRQGTASTCLQPPSVLRGASLRARHLGVRTRTAKSCRPSRVRTELNASSHFISSASRFMHSASRRRSRSLSSTLMVRLARWGFVCKQEGAGGSGLPGPTPGARVVSPNGNSTARPLVSRVRTLPFVHSVRHSFDQHRRLRPALSSPATVNPAGESQWVTAR